MQNIVAALVVLVYILCASTAYAAVYGHEGARFTVTPSDSWTEKSVVGGVQLSNGKSDLIVQMVPDDGLEIEDFADGVIKITGMTNVTKEKNGVLFIVHGSILDAYVHLFFSKIDEGLMLSCMMTGPDVDTMKKMISSIKNVD